MCCTFVVLYISGRAKGVLPVRAAAPNVSSVDTSRDALVYTRYLSLSCDQGECLVFVFSCSTAQLPSQDIIPSLSNRKGLLRQVRLALGLSGPGHTTTTAAAAGGGGGAVEAIIRQDMRFALARWVATALP